MRFVLGIILSCLSFTVQAADLPSLHLDWMDKNVDPAKNFFLYANGQWQKQNAIPKAYARWNNFYILDKKNLETIQDILKLAEKNPKNNIEQKVGDFYFSGMNESAVNQAGIKPLQPELDRIDQIKNLSDLQAAIAHLHLFGVTALFNFNQMQDFKDSHQVIGVASQGGLSLPDRDYYLKQDKKFQKIRQGYLQHLIKVFELLGDDKKKATAEANVVLRIETRLAKAAMARAELRDPYAIYHPMNLEKLNQVTPNFSWEKYFANIQHAELTYINLATMNFFKNMNTQLTQISLNDWKTYLRWHLVGSFSPYLSKPFVEEDFKMMAMLKGVKEPLPRWQRVVNVESQALGFAIGRLYVEKTFPPSSKKQVEEMIQHIRAALKEDLQHIQWMDKKTQKAALEKLEKMRARVGYPDKWWDYSTLNVDRNALYVENVMRASEFLVKREWNKIGKPVDQEEWDMTPQTINAYYDPSTNRLNIPAGILQPPFFDPSAPAAVNYGGIGFVIGHEITHGFDDEGAQFDGSGNLKNWWSENDLKKFQEKTDKIAMQFSRYTVNGETHIQGKLVTGEATADFGGLTLAYRAFHSPDVYQQAKTINGFTPDQQFFLSAAHIWASNVRPEEAEHLVVVDPHPPEIYRINGTFANMPQFKLAYGVSEKSPMINRDRPIIW